MYKAVFWDIDGTLVDSEELHFFALKKVCQNAGYNLEYSLDQFIGVSLVDVWEQLGLKKYFNSKEKWFNSVCDLYENLITPTRVRRNIKKVLGHIKKLNVTQIAVSNGERRIVQANLTKCKLLDYFYGSVSRDEIAYPKPDPESYLMALNLIKIKAAKVIAIEDTPIGIKAAKGAGIRTIAFPNKHTKNMNFHEADVIINDPLEITKILENNHF